MKRLLCKIGPLLLAFLVGLIAKVLWDYHQNILEFLSNPFLYYQD
jgi:hypothetical protein